MARNFENESRGYYEDPQPQEPQEEQSYNYKKGQGDQQPQPQEEQSYNYKGGRSRKGQPKVQRATYTTALCLGLLFPVLVDSPFASEQVSVQSFERFGNIQTAAAFLPQSSQMVSEINNDTFDPDSNNEGNFSGFLAFGNFDSVSFDGVSHFGGAGTFQVGERFNARAVRGSEPRRDFNSQRTSAEFDFEPTDNSTFVNSFPESQGC